MSSLLSSTEIATFTGEYGDFFDTMSQFHTVIVVKKPLEQIVNINDNNSYYGYDQVNANPTNIIYTPVSGVFRCMIVSDTAYPKDKIVESIPKWAINSDVVIKVEQKAKDFIENGLINERMIVDNEVFNQMSIGHGKSYGSLNYYYYALSKTL